MARVTTPVGIGGVRDFLERRHGASGPLRLSAAHGRAANRIAAVSDRTTPRRRGIRAEPQREQHIGVARGLR